MLLLAETAKNNQYRFRFSEVWPTNINIYCEDECHSSYVTDRPYPGSTHSLYPRLASRNYLKNKLWVKLRGFHQSSFVFIANILYCKRYPVLLIIIILEPAISVIPKSKFIQHVFSKSKFRYPSKIRLFTKVSLRKSSNSR